MRVQLRDTNPGRGGWKDNHLRGRGRSRYSHTAVHGRVHSGYIDSSIRDEVLGVHNPPIGRLSEVTTHFSDMALSRDWSSDPLDDSVPLISSQSAPVHIDKLHLKPQSEASTTSSIEVEPADSKQSTPDVSSPQLESPTRAQTDNFKEWYEVVEEAPSTDATGTPPAGYPPYVGMPVPYPTGGYYGGPPPWMAQSPYPGMPYYGVPGYAVPGHNAQPLTGGTPVGSDSGGSVSASPQPWYPMGMYGVS
jgi:hypothetical protein